MRVSNALEGKDFFSRIGQGAVSCGFIEVAGGLDVFGSVSGAANEPDGGVFGEKLPARYFRSVGEGLVGGEDALVADDCGVKFTVAREGVTDDEAYPRCLNFLITGSVVA